MSHLGCFSRRLRAGAGAALALLVLVAGSASAAEVANSITDWDPAGNHGTNGWDYGYYNKSGGSPNTFVQFPRDAGPWSPTNFWDGGAWNWNPDSAPWDYIGQLEVHPNGVNSFPGEEHWVSRRWTADVAGDMLVSWHMEKSNPNGTGTTGHLLVNGVELQALTISGNDISGVTQALLVPGVNVGDRIEVVHDPRGLRNDTTDGADGSRTWMTVQTLAPGQNTRTQLASSSTDWSTTGTQGENGWSYGYWNRTLDQQLDDGDYSSGDVFLFARDGSNTISATNHWNGGNYQLVANPPPWTIVGPQFGLSDDWSHPNSQNGNPAAEEHWTVRRYTAEADGEVVISGLFGRENHNCGEGIQGYVFVNGVQVYSTPVFQNVVTYELAPMLVFIGDTIDFVQSPDNLALADNNDFCDGSYVMGKVDLLEAVVPEPGSIALAGLGAIGLCFAAWRRRRA